MINVCSGNQLDDISLSIQPMQSCSTHLLCLMNMIFLRYTIQRIYIVMRFEVYFRCYRYLGRLLNLFNFTGMINHLWHMGDRYLVTRTPDRMLRHWRRMQMYITYMGMFWGKTLWLVIVCCVAWVREPRIPSGDAGVFWILEWMSKDLYEIDWPGIPIMD